MNHRYIILTFIVALITIGSLTYAYGLQEVGNPRSDGNEVYDMQVYTSWEPDGDNYTVNANVIALTAHDLNWTVKASIVKGDSVNTSAKFRSFVDSLPDPNKQYSTTTRDVGRFQEVSCAMYTNKTLLKGGYYGAVIYLVDDNDYIWRLMGLHIYIGSIVITTIYNSTEWITVDALLSAETWDASGDHATYISEIDGNWCNLEASDGTTWQNETYSMEDHDFSVYNPEGGTIISQVIENITTRCKTMGSNSEVELASSQLSLTSSNQYDTSSPAEIHYDYYYGLNLNVTANPNTWNDTTVELGMKNNDASDIVWPTFYHFAAMLDVEVNSSVVVADVTTVSSSSSSGRDLVSAVIEIEKMIQVVSDIVISNYLVIIGIVGSVVSIVAGYSKVMVSARDRKTKESTAGYRFHVVESDIRKTIRKWLK